MRSSWANPAERSEAGESKDLFVAHGGTSRGESAWPSMAPDTPLAK